MKLSNTLSPVGSLANNKPVALAGVMGGQDTEVNEEIGNSKKD